MYKHIRVVSMSNASTKIFSWNIIDDSGSIVDDSRSIIDDSMSIIDNGK